MSNQEISVLLKNYRINSGIRQIELARRLGYSCSQMVSNWERGLVSPPKRSLGKICRILSIPRGHMKAALLHRYEAELSRLLK
jgi:transcriptional regulator with XRE-family HTH domain